MDVHKQAKERTLRRIKKYYPGSYTLSLLFLVIVTIVLAIGLYTWLRHNMWTSVIPYTIETTIVSNSNTSSLDNSDESSYNYPLSISQEINVTSEDLDVLYNRIEGHIDDYLSFSAVLIGIVFSVICVVVPILNYTFVQKDTVDQLKTYADLLSERQNVYINELNLKKQQYENSLKLIDSITNDVTKTEKEIKELQRSISILREEVDDMSLDDSDHSEFQNRKTADITKTTDFSSPNLDNTVSSSTDKHNTGDSDALNNQAKESKIIE